MQACTDSVVSPSLYSSFMYEPPYQNDTTGHKYLETYKIKPLSERTWYT